MFVHVPTLRDSVYREDVLSLLMECDNDFYPSLSSKRLKHDASSTVRDKLLHYLSEKDLFHHYILCIKKNRVIGMMNFIPTDEAVEIDTFCVRPSLRNQGIGYRFYAFLFFLICPHFQLSTIRTECGNKSFSHLHLLKKLHFRPVSSNEEQIIFEKDASKFLNKRYE